MSIKFQVFPNALHNDHKGSKALALIANNDTDEVVGVLIGDAVYATAYNALFLIKDLDDNIAELGLSSGFKSAVLNARKAIKFTKSDLQMLVVDNDFVGEIEDEYDFEIEFTMKDIVSLQS